jgi:hypothetical protein
MNQLIARGFNPGEGSANALATVRRQNMVEQQFQSDQDYRNSLIQERQADRTAQTDKDAEQQEMMALYPAVKKQDPRAIEIATQRIGQRNPELAQWYAQNPDSLAQFMAQGLGIQEEKPAAPDYRTVGGALVEITPEGPREAYRPSQRAPLRAAGSAPAAGAAPVGGIPPSQPSKPLPISALRIVDDANQAIAASSESKTLVDAAIAKLEGGQVKLGALRNMESRGRNFAGASSENSRAYADVQQTFEKLRNNYMLLAKGVQTEGDAQRAWASEIGEFVQNDNALALRQMKKAQGMIDRAIEAQNARIETIYTNFGSEPPARSAAPGGVVDFNDL